MKKSNVLDRRATKLANEVDRRSDALFRRLVDPTPAFMVRKSEIDALRDYIKVKDNGGLLQLRESQGGPYADEWVDAYVAWGERKLAEHYPSLAMNPDALPNPDMDPEWTGQLEPSELPINPELSAEDSMAQIGGPPVQAME